MRLAEGLQLDDHGVVLRQCGNPVCGHWEPLHDACALWDVVAALATRHAALREAAKAFEAVNERYLHAAAAVVEQRDSAQFGDLLAALGELDDEHQAARARLLAELEGE